MLRMLTLLSTVGAAWALSQYLPSDDLAKESERTAEIVTRSIPVGENSTAGVRSVALVDLAVAVLPASGEPTESAREGQPAGTVTASLAPPTEPVTTAKSEPMPAPATTDVANTESEASGAQTDPIEEAKLTRIIQRELRRVGCLKSAADGVWGKATARAMQRFADRIEADLPVAGPDTVLLILLEKFEDKACGAPCAAGEVPNARGRCEPVEQIAKADEPATAPETKLAGLASDDLTAISTVEKTADPAKAHRVKTKIARVGKAKRVRVARLTPARRKTRWSVPGYYGFGMANAQQPRPNSVVRKKKRRGGAASYRRWMTRAGISMR